MTSRERFAPLYFWKYRAEITMGSQLSARNERSIPESVTTVDQRKNQDLLSAIRQRTRILHDGLEANIDLSRYLGSHSGYRSLLSRYLRVYHPLDRLINHQPREWLELLQWSERPRLARLQSDLRSLGAAAEEILEVPDCSALPEINDLDTLMGALYVIEGSALGGQILYGQIHAKLGLDAHNGASFFFGEGKRTAQVWKWYVSLMQEHVSSAERATHAAVEMFHVFQAVLAGLPQSWSSAE